MIRCVDPSPPLLVCGLVLMSLQILCRVTPFRNFFLDERNVSGVKDPLVLSCTCWDSQTGVLQAAAFSLERGSSFHLPFIN